MLSPAQATLLRQMSIGDQASMRSASTGASVAIDGRTAALVRLAALITRDSALPTYQRAVHEALDAGASVDEIVSLLLVLAEPAGSATVISAAPKLAMALDYDVEAGFEESAP